MKKILLLLGILLLLSCCDEKKPVSLIIYRSDNTTDTIEAIDRVVVEDRVIFFLDDTTKIIYPAKKIKEIKKN